MYSWKGSTTEPLHIALYKSYSGNLDTRVHKTTAIQSVSHW